MARGGVVGRWISILAVAVGGGWIVSRYARPDVGDTHIYRIKFQDAPGWRRMPSSPTALFVFRDAKRGLMMRGAQSQVVAEVNPNPHQTGDDLANFFISTTRANQPGWTAVKSGVVHGKGCDFHLIDRATDDRRVINAFGVNGNTTFVCTLTGLGKGKDQVAAAMNEFRAYLETVEFVPEPAFSE